MEASLSTTYNAQAIVNAAETTLKRIARFALDGQAEPRRKSGLLWLGMS